MATPLDPQEVETEWLRLLAQFSAPDPEHDWFSPVFKPLLEAASKVAVLRRLFPFQAMNQLAFSKTSTYPFTQDLPAIWAGSTGLYAVMSIPRPEGQVLWETSDPQAAADRAAQFIDRP